MGSFVPLPYDIEIIPRDTTPEAFRVQIEALRRLGMEGRSRVQTELCRGMRRTLEAGIRRRHPDYDDRQVKLALIRLTTGEEVFRKLLPGMEVEP
jgi:hypothetical protein